MQAAQHSYQAGDIIAERYRIERLIGEGGMGKVYLVSDTLLASGGENPLLALKILREDLANDEKYRRRFLREVALTRAITHPNVVRTFEVGRDEDRLFFTMEYVDGVALSEKMTGSPLKFPAVAATFAAIARGLGAIHAAGILHRDLKPANIMLTAEGEVKISDFGIAKPAVSELTQQHEMLGSALYMAPEIWRGEEVGPAADIYALGVLAYELFTGLVPFDGAAEPEVMWKHLEQQVTAPSVVTPEVPGWASAAVTAMLDKDPEARPDCEAILLTFESHDEESRSLSGSIRRSGAVPAVTASGLESAPEEELDIHASEEFIAARARYVQEADDARREVLSRRRYVADERSTERTRQRGGPLIWWTKFAAIAAAAPALFLTVGLLILPRMGTSWNTVGESLGSFALCSVLLLTSIALMCAAPVILASAITASFNKTVELAGACAVRFGALCGFWYIGLHCYERIGFIPRAAHLSFRGAMVGIVEQVAQQALQVGLLLPVSPVPPGADSTSLGMESLAMQHPILERIVYAGILAIYLFCLCGALCRVLAGKEKRSTAFAVWCCIGIPPQVAGFFLVAYALARPGTLLARRVIWNMGPLTLDTTVAGVLSAAVTWMLIFAVGIVFAKRFAPAEPVRSSGPL